MYWTGSGWSSPYAARSAASSSLRRFCAPNSSNTGSPGARRSTMNDTTVTPKNVGTA
jgi:hypothetical protein